MLRSTTLDDQLEAMANDPVRVLVVGAGMAGLTLAQLLRRRGSHPVLLERAAEDANRGYMIALLPMVDSLLHELEIAEEYVRNSQGFDRYRIRGQHAGLLREYRMGDVLGYFGDYRGISRAELLRTLAVHGGQVTYGTTVRTLRQDGDRVRVEIQQADAEARTAEARTAEARTAEFDLVVVADGLHSRTRELVLDRQRVEVFDAGWGGWVTWMDADQSPDLGEELWGDDVFVGTYPVLDRIGIFLGGPRDRSQSSARECARVARERLGMPAGSAKASSAARVDRALRAVETAQDCYFWPMVDVRAPRWAYDRVLLLGDAAAGFLPTAGIGAGMAMESAWVLAHHLDGVRDGRRDGDVPNVLRGFERAQRPRVEAAQSNSRSLARLMFRGGRTFSALRDLTTRVVPIGVALKPIRSLLDQRPELPTRG